MTTTVMHVAAIAEAVKASGTIIQLKPEGFSEVLRKSESPLVVVAAGGVFGKKHDYVTSYKGLCFYCRSAEPIQLPTRAEVVHAARLWMPNM